MPREAGYLLIIVSGILTFWLIAEGRFRWRSVLNRRYALVAIALWVLWTGVEQMVLGLGLWRYPQGGTLAPRFFQLPIEEHLFFFMHTLACAMLLRGLDLDSR